MDDTAEKVEDIMTREKVIRLKNLIRIREEMISQITASEIDEVYFRRKSIAEPGNNDIEGKLLSSQTNLKVLKETLGIVEDKIRALK